VGAEVAVPAVGQSSTIDCAPDTPGREIYFSLVISTKGRARELDTLFRSLSAQTYSAFEIILVDQNAEPLPDPDGSTAGRWRYTHLHCPTDAGLSRGRNVGWRVAVGEFVLFPDDDCWYAPEFLSQAKQMLSEREVDVLTGRATDEMGRSINGRFERSPQFVQRRSVWTTQIEWIAFFRVSLLRRLNGYDEQIGVGASSPWQACEGQDIVLRALKLGAVCLYRPDLTGHHPEIDVAHPDSAGIRKARGYGRGMGYVLRLHNFNWAERLYWVCRPLARALGLAVLRRRRGCIYALSVAAGRLEGSSGVLFDRIT
jgi:glycosyltransferase involved in cell wall biosynthesis